MDGKIVFTGNYVINIMWSETPLSRFPIYGMAPTAAPYTPPPQPQPYIPPAQPPQPYIPPAQLTQPYMPPAHPPQPYMPPAQPTQPQMAKPKPVATPAPATPSINLDKIILTGQGLHQAKVNQQAEFVIDGTEAGPGMEWDMSSMLLIMQSCRCLILYNKFNLFTAFLLFIIDRQTRCSADWFTERY